MKALHRLDMPVQFLKGVGPRRAVSLQRMQILTARDLLYHVPRRYDDASTITPAAKARVGSEATVVGQVRSTGVIPTRAGLRIFQAVIQDASGFITCSWPGKPWVERSVQRGDRLLVTGPVRFFHGPQLQPREFVVIARRDEDERATSVREGAAATASGVIFSTYAASEDLPQWVFRRLFDLNLDRLLRDVRAEEYLDSAARSELDLPELSAALDALHRPATIPRKDAALRRLAFDELFLHQLMQARVRHQATAERPGVSLRRTNDLIRVLHHSLPFTLTGAQARVLREIFADMTSRRRMNRLLQGDVGSGKTVVALFAMLLAVEAGCQAALMAPTSILAEQHAKGIGKLLEALPCTLELLTGAATARRRREARARIAAGEAQIVVGTHALIQEGVEFRRLGLAVIDEQHRFGVRQRMALSERAPSADTLLMSATPIPRSLAMTLHGDLDLSIIDELPPGRRPVATRIAGPGKRSAIYDELRRRLDRGRQAYLVFPAIEESERSDLRAAEAEFERLCAEDFAGRRLALLHGRLPAEEKDRIMRGFQRGAIDILVTTTVVEVGIDVPNANTMVIENGERFGLSQLHQLRGRIGRGEEGGLCVVIADAETDRLAAFARTTDGFEIAAADLQIRGQGDFFGADQHGHTIELRFADLFEHQDLIGPAQERARRIVDDDPELADPANAVIRLQLDRRFGERARLFGVG